MAISNGALVARTENEDGTATWHWKQEAEHSAYLVTLVVAEFEEIELPAHNGIPLTAYVRPGLRISVPKLGIGVDRD